MAHHPRRPAAPGPALRGLRPPSSQNAQATATVLMMSTSAECTELEYVAQEQAEALRGLLDHSRAGTFDEEEVEREAEERATSMRSPLHDTTRVSISRRV